jgi:drug/metabolite transporter (DMT)-like permease
MLIAALWGGTAVAISFSRVSLPPVAVAAIRFAMASVFMLFWCRFQQTSIRLRRGQLKPALVAGILLFLQIASFNIGVGRSNSSHGSMRINTFVFWVVAIEHVVTKTDRLTLRKLAGSASCSPSSFATIRGHIGFPYRSSALPSAFFW